MSEERFLWWTDAQWTAIGTGVLVLVTAAYVVITGRIARHAHRSADAAERAAISAADSAATAAAQLQAGFTLIGSVPDSHLMRLIPLAIVWTGHAVFVQGIRLRGRGRRRRHTVIDEPLRVRGLELPSRLQVGDVVECEWPEAVIGTQAELEVDVAYSFGSDSETFHVRRSVPRQPERAAEG